MNDKITLKDAFQIIATVVLFGAGFWVLSVITYALGV